MNTADSIEIKIRDLISTHGDINHRDDRGQTILHFACLDLPFTTLDAFQSLIDSRADINIIDHDNKTPLRYAIEEFRSIYHLNIITLLLSVKGCNLNQKDLDGYTILHYICTNISRYPLELFKLLMEYGADIGSLDNQGRTPLYIAFENFRSNSDSRILSFLLTQNGIDINQRFTRAKTTLLHRACHHIGIFPLTLCQQLIQLGADLGIKNAYAQNPLHLLFPHIESGSNIDIIKYFLSQARSDALNAQNVSGKTALYLICQRPSDYGVDIFKELIRNGANIRIRDNYCMSPIHALIDKYTPELDTNILSFLINLPDIDINTHETGSITTIFHEVCINLSQFPLDAIKCIIDAGVDVNIKSTVSLYTPFAYINFSPNSNFDKFVYLFKQHGITLPQTTEKSQGIDFIGKFFLSHNSGNVLEQIDLVSNNNMIINSADANKYCQWLWHNYKHRLDFVQYFLNKINILGYFGDDLSHSTDHCNLKSSPLRYLHLNILAFKKLSEDNSVDNGDGGDDGDGGDVDVDEDFVGLFDGFDNDMVHFEFDDDVDEDDSDGGEDDVREDTDTPLSLLIECLAEKMIDILA
jgi:ankyrin repeat protein